MRLQLPYIALLLSLSVPCEARQLRVREVAVNPAPFELGPLTLSCVFENTSEACFRSDSSSEGGPGALRYAFRIFDDVSEDEWTSPWMVVPSLSPRATVVSAPCPAFYQANANGARSFEAITVVVLGTDGQKKFNLCRRSYYMWEDGRFHVSPSLTSLRRIVEDSLATARPWQKPFASDTTRADYAGPTPQPTTASVEAESIPRLQVTWGQLKLRYRTK